MQISGFEVLPGNLCRKPKYLIALFDCKQPPGPPPVTLDTYRNADSQVFGRQTLRKSDFFDWQRNMVWFPEKILQHFPPHAPAWATMGYQDTWLLASCLIVNNFLVADQMRRLTSVAKQLGAGIDDFFSAG